jgi:polysaccharide pyruvyl transferase WcaK-like protein
MTWSVSSQRVQSRAAKAVFGWALRDAAALSVRDQHTSALFRECGVRSEIFLTPDPAFALKTAPEPLSREILSRALGERDHDRALVAFTPRRLRGADREAETHYNPKEPEEIQLQIECYAAALDWAWEQGYQPLFVPMNPKAPDDDRIAAKQIIARAHHGGSALLIDEGLRPFNAPGLYSLCEFSLVSRVHGGITSMIGGCPMAMYAFAPKHAGIMAEMGMAKFSIPEREATPARTIQTLSALRDGLEAIQAEMHIRLGQLRAEAHIPARLAARILAHKTLPSNRPGGAGS